MRASQIFGLIGCLILVSLVACIVVDCSCGQTKHYECQVIDHRYEPMRTEVYTTTDTDGVVTVHTVVHPEEFHLICSELGGEKVFDTVCFQRFYNQVTNRQQVTVKVRQGKWSKTDYLPTVQL